MGEGEYGTNMNTSLLLSEEESVNLGDSPVSIANDNHFVVREQTPFHIASKKEGQDEYISLQTD